MIKKVAIQKMVEAHQKMIDIADITNEANKEVGGIAGMKTVVKMQSHLFFFLGIANLAVC